MAYKVIILHSLYMPSYFLGAFTEYPNIKKGILGDSFFYAQKQVSGIRDIPKFGGCTSECTPANTI